MFWVDAESVTSVVTQALMLCLIYVCTLALQKYHTCVCSYVATLSKYIYVSKYVSATDWDLHTYIRI